MWENILIGLKSFFILKIPQENNLQIYLSDFINIWSKCYSKEMLVEKFQECNPLVKTNPEIVMEHIVNFLNPNKEDVLRDIHFFESSITLNMSFRRAGFKISFHFELQKDTPEIFYRKLTVPLLLMAEELDYRQKLLSTMLLDKDKEILEYNLEGAAISRKSVMTKTFEEDVFVNKCDEGLKERSMNFLHKRENILTQNLCEKLMSFSETILSENGKIESSQVLEEQNNKIMKPSITKKIVRREVCSKEQNSMRRDEEEKKEVTIKRSKRKNNEFCL